jgi:AcrR family transcriptional regulator
MPTDRRAESAAQAHVRPPRQQRSRESFERVLAAGLDVLADGGYEGFTIGEVARRAGVAVGTIYGRFGNKDALFRALQDRILDRIDADQAERFRALTEGSRTADDVVRGAVGEVARIFDRHAALLRVVMLRGAVDPAVLARGSASSQALARDFARTLIARRDDLGHPDPELAADVCFRMVYDVLARRVMYGPTFESGRALEWDELVGELTTACSAYLGLAPRPARPASP